MYLADRDCELLSALVFKVRLCSLEQITGAWWGGKAHTAAVRARLGELARCGLVHCMEPVILSLKKPLSGPLFCWEPAASPPDTQQLAAYVKTRWTQVPRPTPVYFATRFSADWMGGSAARLRRTDATHDLHVTEAYLYFRRRDTQAASAWVGEDVKGKAGDGMKDPDAFLQYEGGRNTAIEFLGQSYTDKTISAFHEYCVKFELAYQLW